MSEPTQIKSKLRVKELAEVFTNEREVNAMLDLVKKYSYDIEKRFFEPACGTGNFLVKILERKLSKVKELYEHKSIEEFEFQTILAISTIYGVDICPINVKQSIARMHWKTLEHFMLSRNTELPSKNFYKNIHYVLNKNIMHGNTLEDEDILIFTEFTFNIKKKSFIEKKFLFKELFNDVPKPLRNTKKDKPYYKLGAR